jgi:sugar lactone lactonase YvrE
VPITSPRAFRLPMRLVSAALPTLIATACGSDNHSTAPHAGGTLTVTVTAPSGSLPVITVTGPANYQQTLTGTQTLTGLAAGNYTITAGTVTTNDPIAPTVDSAVIAGNPATVTTTAPAAASVSYTPRHAGSGALWVLNGNTGTATSFTGPQLQSTGSPTPTNVLTFAGGDPLGVAFDTAGNLWATDFVNNAVLKYTPAQLVVGGTPTATVTLSGPALNHPHALAFDAQGNLWVASRGANTIVEYSASQLTTTGTPTPTVTVTASTASAGPTALAFDGEGDLWVGNFYVNTVVEYLANQLTTSGTVTPIVTLSSTANSLAGPFVMAFDANGTMWVGNANGVATTIVGFSPSQVMTSGSPVPAYTVALPGSSPSLAFGLAFDASGDLWVSDALKNLLYDYTPSQLIAGGQPTPTSTITSNAVNGPGGIAFNPHASTLPLH